MDKKLQVIIVPIKDLKPYEGNAKEHPRDQIDALVGSIEELGFNDPLGVDENNVILEGHGRYLALKQMGVEEVPVVVLDHMDEIQKKQYVLAHNQFTLSTGFNKEILSQEFKRIDDGGYDLEVMGFKEDQIKKIIEEPIKDIEEVVNLNEEESEDGITKQCPHCGGEL